MLLLLGGFALGLLVLTVIIGVTWYIQISFYEPMLGYSTTRTTMVKMSAENFITALASTIFYLPLMFVSAVSQVFTNIMTNMWQIFFLFLLATACFGWLEYHDKLIAGYIVARQCIVMPFTNFFLFPLLNMVRIAYDSGIILWDFYYDLFAFYEWGPVIIFIKCTVATTDASNLFAYFGNIFYVFVQDVVAWFSAGFLDHDLDVTNTLDAIGLWVDTLVAPLICFCKDLGFWWTAVAVWARLPSLHAAINCFLNIFVRLAQIPIRTVMNTPHRPQWNLTALEICCAVKQAGVATEDLVFLLAEVFFGLISNSGLPLHVAQFTSTHWSRVVTYPVCSVFILTNMTLTGVTWADQLFDSTGVAYFQFGRFFDEWKTAAFALGSVFVVFNNDAVAFITEGLLTIINTVAFLFEWIVGNIYYFLYGGPLDLYPSAPFQVSANFLEFYFRNYWQLPTLPGQTTALNDAFGNVFMTTQALGNLFANLFSMDSLGGLIQHTLNALVCLIRVVLNLISYIWSITTFDSDPATTARQVDFDCFFNELYFLAGSAGDFFRQFAQPDPITNTTCIPTADETDQSVFCCVGALVEEVIDVFTIIGQQWIHFLQDLLTLPTGNVHFCISFLPFNHSDTARCIRIPDITVALFLLDQAICEFTCTVFSIIPLLGAFECQFPPPVPPTDPHVPPEQGPNCGHVSTCLADLVCKLLRFLVVPLKIVNMYFVQTINGVSFSDFTVLGQVIAQQFADALALALISFGQLVDCTLCAFITHASPNCDTAIIDLFVSIAQLVRFLPLILTRLFTIVVKLVMTVIIGLFTGNPIEAAVNFIVGLLEDLFGGLAKAAVNFLVSLLNAIGLGFLGTFLDALYNGLCPLLEGIVNIIIVILKAVTFGLVPIEFANFCCDGNPSCVPTNKRGLAQFGLIDGVLYVDQDNWLTYITQLVTWEPDHPCNVTMQTYEGMPLSNLTEWQQGEVLFCLNARYWLVRNDDQSPMRNTTCYVLLIENNGTAWFQVDMTTRRIMMECMFSRFYTDALRVATNLTWIPSDWMYNPYRKFVFGTEVMRGLAIYWQFASDRRVTSDTFLSPTYQSHWAGMNLNTSCYANVTTPQDVAIFRSRYHLKNYFEWNNARQYEAVVSITTGFWSLVGYIATSLANTSISLSDTTVDPAVLVTYNYFLSNPSSGVNSAVYSLFGELAMIVKNISAYWSNPDNLKKRELAYEKVRKGTWGMYQAAINQLTMAGVEYHLLQREAVPYWRGMKPGNETEAFLATYHHELHHDNRSVVYKLSHWWKENRATLFVPHRLINTREGDRRLRYNQSETLFQYKHPRSGQMMNETGYERLWRFYHAVEEGSPASRRRWNSLARIYTIVKERIYHNAVKSNLEFAVEYIRRTYETGWRAKVVPSPPQPVETPPQPMMKDDLWERHYASLAEKGVKLVSSRNRMDYSVYTLRKAEQALHCENDPKMMGDGLCQDYVRIPVQQLSDEVMASVRATTILDQSSQTEYSLFRKDIVRESPGKPYGIVVPSNSTIRFLIEGAMKSARLSLVSAESLITLTCLTNLSFDNTTLCEACFFLDQLLGRIEFGLGWVLGYYTGGQFGDALGVALNFSQYIADDTSRVVVGDGPDLPVGEFPGRGGFAWDIRYWGDATPNKLRFNDIAALINGNGTNNTSNVTGSITLDFFYINGWVGYIIIKGFYFVWDFVVDAFSLASGGSGGNITLTFDFLVDWLVLCDWLGGTDFLGTNKRFSVGEVLFGLFCTDVILSVVFISTVQFNPVNILLGMLLQVVGTVYALVAFWTIQTNFSVLCYFGLPVNAVDDALYFIFYTLCPKCEWFLGFSIADATYDNNSCAACDNAGGWNILNCVRDKGFGDILANTIFMFQKYAPWALEWLRESRIPPVSIFVSIPYVNARLNAFAGVDFTDPVAYRNYVGCNYIGTLVFNLIIGLCFMRLVRILWPLIAFVFSFLANILALVYRDYLFVVDMVTDMQVTAAMAPLIVAGYVDTPVAQHVREETFTPDEEDLVQEERRSRRRMPGTSTSGTGRRVGSMANLKSMLRSTLDNLMGKLKNE